MGHWIWSSKRTRGNWTCTRLRIRCRWFRFSTLLWESCIEQAAGSPGSLRLVRQRRTAPQIPAHRPRWFRTSERNCLWTIRSWTWPDHPRLCTRKCSPSSEAGWSSQFCSQSKSKRRTWSLDSVNQNSALLQRDWTCRCSSFLRFSCLESWILTGCPTDSGSLAKYRIA